MTSRSTDFILGTMYDAYFSISATRSAGSSSARSAANCPLVSYCCQWRAMISRISDVDLLGVPFWRPPMRPLPSFFGLAMFFLCFCDTKVV